MKSDFLKSAVALMTGTAIAQAVPVLAMPLLTRVYSPEDFGEVALFLQIAQVLMVVATGRYDQAIQLPRAHFHAAQLFAVSRLFTWAVAALTLVAVAVLYSFTSLEISGIYWLLPVLVFFMSAVQQETQWLMRHRQFSLIGKSKVGFVSVSVPARLGLGFLHMGPYGLAIGTTLGSLTSWLMLGYQGWRLRRDHQYSSGKMKALAREHRDFPLVNSFHALSDVARELLMLYFIKLHFGDVSLGIYSVSLRIVRAPMMLLGSAIGQVFYQRASEKVANGESILSLTRRTLKILVIIAVPLFGLLALLGEQGFAFLLGEEYREVGRVVQIMAPWLFLHLLTSPFSQVPMVLRKQKSFIVIAMAGNILQVLAVALGPLLFGKDSFHDTLWLLTAVGGSYMLILVLWVQALVKKSDS